MDLSVIPLDTPPPGVFPNFTNPATMSTIGIVVGITISCIAFIFTCIRFYSAVRITRSVGYDDYAVIAAFSFALAQVCLFSLNQDDARHSWDIPLSNLNSYAKLIFIELMIGSLCFSFAKLAILILFFRLFAPNRPFRFALYFGAFWAVLVYAITIVLSGALCAPRSTESFSSLELTIRCGRISTWLVVQSAFGVLLDFYIFFLPIPIIWKLKLGTKRKIGILGIFMTGLVACVASILSLYYKVELMNRGDTAWKAYKVEVINIVESYTTIMVACMPACAAFSRHLSANFSTLRSMKSPFSLSQHRKAISDESNERTNPIVDRNPCKKNVSNFYWRLRNRGEQGNIPPQITGVKGQSRVLVTGEFDIFENKTVSTPEKATPERVSIDLETKPHLGFDAV